MAVSIAKLTLTPNVHLPGSIPMGNKFYHALAFGALIAPTAVLEPRWLARAAMAVLAYAGAIEIVQAFVGRSADLVDFLADAIGVGLILVLAGVVETHLSRS